MVFAPCSACQHAVDTFLADPVLRDKAIVRLMLQRDNWADGIAAKHRQIAELEHKRTRADDLILMVKMAGFPA